MPTVRITKTTEARTIRNERARTTKFIIIEKNKADILRAWFIFSATVAGAAKGLEFYSVNEVEKADNFEEGILVTNPPYGIRIGEKEEAKLLMKELGDFLKQKCKGKTGYVFTGNLELAKAIRLKPSRRIEFFNATIDCRLLEYEMYAGTKRTDKLENV